MYLLYTISVNGDIYKRRIIRDEKATYEYLNKLEVKGKEEFSKYHGLKVKSKMNYLKFSFVNDNYDYIEHVYELKKEDEEDE